MFSAIRDLTSAAVGLVVGAAVAIAVCVAVYEGLPFGLVDGRVDEVRRAAREGYVQEARAVAAEVKAAELQRQLDAGRKALAGYAELLAAAQRAEMLASDELEKRISDYEALLAAAGRSCLLDKHDLDWLRQ